MTLCPIALAVGCKKCAIFSVCPVKGVIGDYKPEAKPEAKSTSRKIARRWCARSSTDLNQQP
ncbi:MAG TPA: hypothetical protein PKN64_16080 [Casimicrobium sp.]|nr:hypothetical protein [Casimicrobium sp.]